MALPQTHKDMVERDGVDGSEGKGTVESKDSAAVDAVVTVEPATSVSVMAEDDEDTEQEPGAPSTAVREQQDAK